MLKDNLKERRSLQHKANEKNKGKTRITVPHQTFQTGDIVMYREMPNLDSPRDTFVVVEDDGGDVMIRKMVKQLRLKITAEVAPKTDGMFLTTFLYQLGQNY